MRICLAGILLLLFVISSPAQSPVDSLLLRLGSALPENEKADIYNALAMEFRNSNPDTSVYFAKEALRLSEKTGHKAGMAGAHLWLGTAITNLGKYREAHQHLALTINLITKSILAKEPGNNQAKKLLARAYNNRGNIFDNEGNYPEALRYHFSALKIREEIGDKAGISNSYNNIGIIYTSQGNYPEALKNLFSCLKIKQEIGSKDGMATAYGNIGNVYMNQSKYEEALKYQMLDLEIAKELQDKTLMAYAYGNIGNIYATMGKLDEALVNQQASMKYLEETGIQRAISNTYNNMGDILTQKGKYPEALEAINKGLALARQMGARNLIKESYLRLAVLDSLRGNWKGAYFNNLLMQKYHDSILNEENIKKTVQAEMNYEFDKKQAAEKAMQEQKDAVAREERQKQVIVRNALIAGFCFVLLLAMIIFRGYREKKKTNEVISLQKKAVEEKNRAITDSINYAQRIQQSVLVSEEEIKKYLPDFFIFFSPRDIVSGDFYWVSQVNNKIIASVIDCTGHGVPGAFMSMIGSILMNEIINDRQITAPDEILRELNHSVRLKLQQEKGDDFSQDGMDVTLCTIDRDRGVVQFAGAQNPLYVVRKGQCEVIKGDNFSVGGKMQRHEASNERIFRCHTFPIEKGMMLYLVSDGYADQFGGEVKKKFGIQRLVQLLADQSHLGINEQKNMVSSTIQQWKGANRQVDDMLLMGIRL